MSDDTPQQPDTPGNEGASGQVPPPLPSQPSGASEGSQAASRVVALDRPDNDTATQSLADALSISFWFLRVLMVLGVISYLALTGMARVAEGEQAVRLRFGKVIEVHGPGAHFGMPYPIDRVVKVRVRNRSVRVEDAFYYMLEENQQAMDAAALANAIRSLNPEEDGSLITADQDLVHARIAAEYDLNDPESFLRNVGLAEIGARDRRDNLIQDPMHAADEMVQNALQQAMVRYAAETPTLAFRQATNHSRVRELAQKQLEELETGIELRSVTVQNAIVPPPVEAAYSEVLRAESEGNQARSRAEEGARETLNGAAGPAYRPLLTLIESYEDGRDFGTEEEAAALLVQIREAYHALSIDGEVIAGEAAQRINAARAEATSIVDRAQREEAVLLAYIESQGYQVNPELVRSRLATDALRDVLSGELGRNEVFYLLPDVQPYLVINRDPQVIREAQEAEIRADEEAREDE